MPEISHGTAWAYRQGCRCPDCRAAHAEETRAARRQQLYGAGGALSPDVRKRVIKLVRSGKPVMEAAREVGVTHQAVYSAAKALPEFGEALRDAESGVT